MLYNNNEQVKQLNRKTMAKKELLEINDKNILTDVIYDIFDNSEAFCGGKKDNTYIGFVDDIPTIATIMQYSIKWFMQNENGYEELKSRILSNIELDEKYSIDLERNYENLWLTFSYTEEA